jgi:hypothetical protein
MNFYSELVYKNVSSKKLRFNKFSWDQNSLIF